jgi:hypothetical protein
VVNITHSIRTYISLLFSLLLDGKKKEEKKKLEERLLDTIDQLIVNQREERDFFKSWLTGFQTTAAQPAQSYNHDADLIEALEDEARLGNVLAQDIVASDDKIRDYLRTIKEAH